MNPPDGNRPQPDGPQDDRKARLARQLRANLQRRKAQARSRREDRTDSRSEGLTREEGDDQESNG